MFDKFSRSKIIFDYQKFVILAEYIIIIKMITT